MIKVTIIVIKTINEKEITRKTMRDDKIIYIIKLFALIYILFLFSK